MRKITKIILHCSDSSFGDAATIDQWHKDRGWDGIGYHHVILNGILVSGSAYIPRLDGKIEIGRPIEKVGAQCYGHNSHSIGICLIGKPHHFTVPQIKSAETLCRQYIKQFNLSVSAVYGHCELDSGKTCPGFDMPKFRGVL